MTDRNDPAELERLRARVAQLEGRNASKPAWGFSGGFFGCFGIVAAVFVLIFVLVGMGQCSSNIGSSTHVDSSQTRVTSVSSSATLQSASSNWTYNSTSDPMSDKKTNTACTTSTNEITQSFPYHDTSAHLCLRQSPKFGLDAYVELDGSGQILCDIEGCRVAVRFNKEPAQYFPAVEAADHSTNIIFINHTSRLIAKLKKASTTAIEVTFYQNGVQPLTFITANLKWP